MLETLLNQLRSMAPDVVHVPILQPADPFLETAGEDMRRRIFITETANGTLQCLRPEFTIPICLAHISAAGAGAARYAYGGTVFRQSRLGSDEFQQAGLEDLGNTDTAGADAACLADVLNALATVGITRPQVTLGDQNLFSVVVENLQLPPAIAARLTRNFGDQQQIARLIDDLQSEPLVQPNSAEGEAEKLALAGDETALINHVSDLMAAGNMSPKAGRSPQDIARRMIEKSKTAHFRLDAEHANVLRQFLALELPLQTAADDLARFAANSGLDFGDSLTLFQTRAGRLVERGIPLSEITYRASFGRNLDYYTGLLFEVEYNGAAIAGGGRYDRLCTLLGHETPVPAVGFSITLDRAADAQNGGTRV